VTNQSQTSLVDCFVLWHPFILQLWSLCLSQTISGSCPLGEQHYYEVSKIEKLYFSIHCAQSSLSIVFYSDNSNGQESQESPGLSFDASYKLQRKLHHNDNPGEVSLSNNVMNNCKPIKSGTEPVLKSKDDFWVGDGADVECNFHGIAKQGTTPAEFLGDMTVQVSSKSAALKRRREARKVAAQQQAAQQQVAQQQAVQTHVQERPSPNDIAIKQNVDNEVSVKKDDKDIGAYCVPIILPDVEDESDFSVVFKKKKANHSYNMRRRCEQRLIRHFNR